MHIRCFHAIILSSSFLCIVLFVDDAIASSHNAAPSISIRLPGNVYENDDEDYIRRRRGWGAAGLGREFDLFDTRGGNTPSHLDKPGDGDDTNHEDDEQSHYFGLSGTNNAKPASSRQAQRPPQPRTTRSLPRSNYLGSGAGGLSGGSMQGAAAAATNGGSRYGNKPSSSSSAYSSRQRPTVFQSVQEWWTCNIAPTVKNWPRIQCRVEPTTTLKIRKTFRPLKTIVRLGADFNTQLGVWQFKSSWEDAIIGGKITLAGKELQLSKSWQLSVGAVEDLVTRLRFRAAVDLQTWKAYARVGFRTERLSPINIMEGFTLLKQLPLDGNKGNVKLEVKANFALPEPEIEYSTESHRSLVGMGDIEVNIDELNLVLDY